jgi:hypothetical protein
MASCYPETRSSHSTSLARPIGKSGRTAPGDEKPVRERRIRVDSGIRDGDLLTMRSLSEEPAIDSANAVKMTSFAHHTIGK